jgi:hypothetical protein
MNRQSTSKGLVHEHPFGGSASTFDSISFRLSSLDASGHMPLPSVRRAAKTAFVLGPTEYISVFLVAGVRLSLRILLIAVLTVPLCAPMFDLLQHTVGL